MANKLYQNFVLENEIEQQLLSTINHQRFVTLDNTLVGKEGMKKIIHKYTATSGAQKLEMGEGNTKDIEVNFTEEEYKIALVQTRFPYFDEEQMTDVTAVATGVKMVASDMWNVMNADIMAEFNKGTQTLAGSYGFDSFADATAMIKDNWSEEDPATISNKLFALVNKKDVAALRKALKDDLKYVEAFARTGYVGTVAGIDLYTDKLATEKTIIVSTRDAVTLFNKTGVEVETDRDVNTRKNYNYARKYYIAALTDDTKLVKITIA